MSGYTKLFSSILKSTVWREKDHVRIVWITMLAMSDRDGLVEASVPGLADEARVDLERCEQALEVLSSPDKYSRTQDYEGRRITAVDGGWLILNHAKYRERASLEAKREAAAIRQQRKRDRHAASRSVTQSNAIASASASPKASSNAERESDARARPRDPFLETLTKDLTTSSDEIPDDWQPKPAEVALAKSRKLNNADESEKYRCHCKVKKAVSGDWDAGYRKWLLGASEFAKTSQNGSQGPRNGNWRGREEQPAKRTAEDIRREYNEREFLQRQAKGNA